MTFLACTILNKDSNKNYSFFITVIAPSNSVITYHNFCFCSSISRQFRYTGATASWGVLKFRPFKGQSLKQLIESWGLDWAWTMTVSSPPSSRPPVGTGGGQATAGDGDQPDDNQRSQNVEEATGDDEQQSTDATENEEAELLRLDCLIENRFPLFFGLGHYLPATKKCRTKCHKQSDPLQFCFFLSAVLLKSRS